MENLQTHKTPCSNILNFCLNIFFLKKKNKATASIDRPRWPRLIGFGGLDMENLFKTRKVSIERPRWPRLNGLGGLDMNGLFKFFF